MIFTLVSWQISGHDVTRLFSQKLAEKYGPECKWLGVESIVKVRLFETNHGSNQFCMQDLKARFCRVDVANPTEKIETSDEIMVDLTLSILLSAKYHTRLG